MARSSKFRGARLYLDQRLLNVDMTMATPNEVHLFQSFDATMGTSVIETEIACSIEISSDHFKLANGKI